MAHALPPARSPRGIVRQVRSNIAMWESAIGELAARTPPKSSLYRPADGFLSAQEQGITVPALLAKPMHRQVLLLAGAQALYQTAGTLVATVGALAGAQLAGASPGLATAPNAAIFLGTALTTFPASLWMARVGRRAGFVAGTLLGVAGGLTAAFGLTMGSLALLCLGTFLIGCYQAFAQFYRFAAGEIADESYRPRAIAIVLGGGVVAAFLGPFLGRVGGPLLEPAYVGSFLLVAMVSLVATGMLLGLRIPPAPEDGPACAPARSWRAIVVQPAYLTALFAAATGYGVMVLAMTATPVAMGHHHHGLPAVATVIQFHVLAMFLPSFFTGSLIARIGVVRLMLVGVALLAGHVLISLSGYALPSFIGALVLLGVGWNFLYIGGTTLLTSTYSAAEKGRAQATNDVTIFTVGLTCSFGSGLLLDLFGWQALNLLLLPWLAVAACLLVWHGHYRRRVRTWETAGAHLG